MSDGLNDRKNSILYCCSYCQYVGYQEDFYSIHDTCLCKNCYHITLKNSTGLSLNTKDDVNHPSHYTAYKGVEVIQLTEQMNFNRGNAVKYICRAGLKNKDKEVEDLQKAIWYLNREIERIQKD